MLAGEDALAPTAEEADADEEDDQEHDPERAIDHEHGAQAGFQGQQHRNPPRGQNVAWRRPAAYSTRPRSLKAKPRARRRPRRETPSTCGGRRPKTGQQLTAGFHVFGSVPSHPEATVRRFVTLVFACSLL